MKLTRLMLFARLRKTVNTNKNRIKIHNQIYFRFKNFQIPKVTIKILIEQLIASSIVNTTGFCVENI